MTAAPSGQVLVVLAIIMAILLAFAGVAIDMGRQTAERRHVQTAADAGALAGCRALIDGATDADAALAAELVARANLEGSPAGGVSSIASPPSYVDEDGSGAIDADELVSGIVVAGTTVRVAIASTVDTAIAKVVGVPTLGSGARARCDLQGGTEAPLVVRRYAGPLGPGAGFIDHLATAATSGVGVVDAMSPLGFDLRVPASEGAPGPSFVLYGPSSIAANDPSFHGFVALDVRNFETAASRVYFNGIDAATDAFSLATTELTYLADGYPGPGLPAVSGPGVGATQLGALTGDDPASIVDALDDAFRAGDRILLPVYDSTLNELPELAVTPPAEVRLPSTTLAPVAGPTLRISRNPSFPSTVTLSMRGDAEAGALGFPALDILPVPSVLPPGPGDMSEAIWSVNGFAPAVGGTTVTMSSIETNLVPPGIYTVWLDAVSADPSYERRELPIAVRVETDLDNDGDTSDVGDIPATRDFSLVGSVLDGARSGLGATINLPILVSTGSGSGDWSGGPLAASPIALSWDTSSLTGCDLTPRALGVGAIGFGTTPVTPLSGSPASSTLTISTTGLAADCYLFTIRATGTNSDGQPVTHLEKVRFSVGTGTSDGQYVDVIGFAVFEIDSIGGDEVIGHAVSGMYADPNDPGLRRAQRARLEPWS